MLRSAVQDVDPYRQNLNIRNCFECLKYGIQRAPIYHLSSRMASLEPISQNDIVLAPEHLSRAVGAVTLVNDVTVHVRARELVAAGGPSGSGTNSFLRLLHPICEPPSAPPSVAALSTPRAATRST